MRRWTSFRIRVNKVVGVFWRFVLAKRYFACWYWIESSEVHLKTYFFNLHYFEANLAIVYSFEMFYFFKFQKHFFWRQHCVERAVFNRNFDKKCFNFSTINLAKFDLAFFETLEKFPNKCEQSCRRLLTFGSCEKIFCTLILDRK